MQERGKDIEVSCHVSRSACYITRLADGIRQDSDIHPPLNKRSSGTLSNKIRTYQEDQAQKVIIITKCSEECLLREERRSSQFDLGFEGKTLCSIAGPPVLCDRHVDKLIRLPISFEPVSLLLLMLLITGGFMHLKPAKLPYLSHLRQMSLLHLCRAPLNKD